jgi:hypothetical protein
MDFQANVQIWEYFHKGYMLLEIKWLQSFGLAFLHKPDQRWVQVLSLSVLVIFLSAPITPPNSPASDI